MHISQYCNFTAGLQYHEYVVYPRHAPCPLGHSHIADDVDCHAFYHCKVTFWGAEMVKKSCGPTMMFNIESATCDWPYRVVKARPECSIHSNRYGKNNTLQQL